jgi:hypothetical protein
VTRIVVLSALALVVVFACTIEHRSEDFECSSTEPCTGGRVCQDGLCVIPGGAIDARIDGNGTIDGRLCPDQCTSCVFPTMTCMIDSESGAQIECPEGWHCVVSCEVSQACSQVDCEKALSCLVVCSGGGSCDDVRCGPGDCDVTCSGPGSCAVVDCDQSCACDVRCQSPTSCANGNNISCPPGCQFGFGCSSGPLGCNDCM